MRKEDLIHTIDAITPGDGLRAKVMSLPARSRPRLEHPLRHVLSFGAAALMCAGVVAAVLALENAFAPNEKLAGSAPNPNTAAAAASGNETATPAKATPMLTPTPQNSDLGTKLTLPAGIIPPDQAISIAEKALKDYYGLDTKGCVVIDAFSYSQAIVYGTGELFEPMYRQNEFAGKKLLTATFFNSESSVNAPGGSQASPPVWHFEFRMDGTADDSASSVQIAVNALTGDVIGGPAG